MQFGKNILIVNKQAPVKPGLSIERKGKYMKRYLLNVTFYGEETERDLFLLCIDSEITEKELKEIFNATYERLSYEEELNINMLMENVGTYVNGEVKEIYSNMGHLQEIDNYYAIEQEQ